jgi:hypothetical protein
MSIRGSVDELHAEGAFGWAFADGLAGPLVVQGLLGGRIIGEAAADQERPDLAAAGLGDGRCGFAMRFYDALDPAQLAFVSLRPQGGDVELPRTNLTGYADFFRALHARHPGAGRHRSVFGGLWTDRTDAARLLAGRIAAGATPADLLATLKAHIEDGYVVLRSALAPMGLAGTDAALLDGLDADQPLDPRATAAERRLLEALPGLAFREVALRALRGIFDDNPVCYRAALARGTEALFVQPSSAEALPSPAECVVLVACGNGPGLALDVVRGSHALPEFTADGRSRWLPGSGAPGLELALAQGASIETQEIGPQDLALLGPGTLHRLRVPEQATALRAWCAPQRVTPTSFLAGPSGTFVVRHHSGSLLAV